MAALVSMSRARLSCLVCLALILSFSAWVGFVSVRPSEPVYEGHRLTEWLYENWKGPPPDREFVGPSGTKSDSERAIRAIGTNALPTLLKLMAAKDSALKTQFTSLLRRQSLLKINLVDAHSQRFQAYLGFKILGPDAKDAVPGLVKLARSDDVDIRDFSLGALDFLNPDKKDFLPLLVDLIRDSRRSPYDPDPSVGYRAAGILYRRFPEETENTDASKSPEFIKWATSNQLEH